MPEGQLGLHLPRRGLPRDRGEAQCWLRAATFHPPISCAFSRKGPPPRPATSSFVLSRGTLRKRLAPASPSRPSRSARWSRGLLRIGKAPASERVSATAFPERPLNGHNALGFEGVGCNGVHLNRLVNRIIKSMINRTIKRMIRLIPRTLQRAHTPGHRGE